VALDELFDVDRWIEAWTSNPALSEVNYFANAIEVASPALAILQTERT
jgi:hypothetical protein